MSKIYVTTPYDVPMSCHLTKNGAEEWVCDFIRKENRNKLTHTNKEILNACSVYIKEFELKD